MGPSNPQTGSEVPQTRNRTSRFPITPTVCLALAGQTFQACIRRRVLLVLILFAGFVAASYWVAPANFPQKRVELVIRASLMSAAFFSVIVVVFLSATTLPEDISRRTIYTVLTKPVGRLNYLLGRVLGFSAVAAVLLVVMGIISLGFIRYAALRVQHATPGSGYQLATRQHLAPEKIALRAQSDAPDQEPPLDESTGKAVLKGDRLNTLVFYFDGKALTHRRGQDVSVSLDVEVRAGERLPKGKVRLVAVNPVDGTTDTVETELDSFRQSTVTFTPGVVDPKEGMILLLTRLEYSQILVTPDAVSAVLSHLPFEVGLFKSLMMTFFGLVALTVIGVMSSVFVSKWLAVVMTFSAYLIGVFSQVIRDLMTKLQAGGPLGFLGTDLMAPGAPGAQTVEPAAWITVLNKIYLGLFKVVTLIIPDFRNFNSSSLVAGGYDVPIGIWSTALLYATIYVLVYLAVAQLLWFRREVSA